MISSKILKKEIKIGKVIREDDEYKVLDMDKDGNVISGYPDGEDHAISALRYAYEPLFNKRGYHA